MIMFDVVSHKNISFKTYTTIFFGVFLISVIMFMSSILTTEAERDSIIPSWIKIMRVGGPMGK